MPWQREPLRDDAKDTCVVIEADAMEEESRGRFTLKVWNEDGTRSIALTGRHGVAQPGLHCTG